MKKFFYLTLLVATTLVSCSNDTEVTAVNEDSADAVSFDVYAGRATRGNAQNVDIYYLKNPSVGFGVYAYSTGVLPWASYVASKTYPNFMYNQKVTWSTTESKWEYDPVKYWPNETGAKVSFFAYAPYNESDGNLVLATQYNGPAIRYIASVDATEQKDLLWGKSVNSDDAKAFVDQTKPNTTATTKFIFAHALSKVDFQIKPFIDLVHDGSHSDVGEGTANTTITIRSIKLIGAVPSQGVLSLYDGSWTIEAANEGAYTLTGQNLYKEEGCTTQSNTFTISQSDADGIRYSKPWFVIPSGTEFKIQISYDVTTTSTDDHRNSNTTNNVITSTSSYQFQQGKYTTFKLDLGLTSVKFDAWVKTWGTAGEVNVDLPNNQ